MVVSGNQDRGTIENGRTSYRGYDALNRLIEYRDGEGNTFGYAYYPDGRLHVLTYPVPAGQPAKTVTYAYDAFGRLGTVTDWAGRVTSYTYDDASRLTRLDSPNGTHREQEYDAASQLRFVKEFRSDGSYLAYQELRYDDDGRIVWRFLHPAPAPVTLAADTLLYDDDNRLSSWNSSGVTFDADGNLTNGPLPSGVFGAYGYDARNRLTSASGSGYRYSAEGARVQVTGTDAATYVVDPNAALSRTLVRVKGVVTTYYVYGLGLLYEETAGATKTYHYDHLGSTLALTTDGLTVTDRWSYAPFGVVTSRTGTSDTSFQLHGEMGVMTDSSGLVCMRARYYHPRLMRFCNADPIGFGGGLNWYAAFDNNPITKTDPRGLFGDGQLAAIQTGMSPADVAKIPLGHSDMGYHDPNYSFNYTRADHEFSTSPFSPISVSLHFQTHDSAWAAAVSAADRQDKKWFENAVHFVADVRSHTDAGYKTFGGPGIIGHLLQSILAIFGIGNDPDNNPSAWSKANNDVKALEDHYKAVAASNGNSASGRK